MSVRAYAVGNGRQAKRLAVQLFCGKSPKLPPGLRRVACHPEGTRLTETSQNGSALVGCVTVMATGGGGVRFLIVNDLIAIARHRLSQMKGTPRPAMDFRTLRLALGRKAYCTASLSPVGPCQQHMHHATFVKPFYVELHCHSNFRFLERPARILAELEQMRAARVGDAGASRSRSRRRLTGRFEITSRLRVRSGFQPIIRRALESGRLGDRHHRSQT